LTEYLQGKPDQVSYWAHQAAELQARIHSTNVSELPPLVEILHMSVQAADPLTKNTRQQVLDLLHRLPDGNALCHNDYYPRNLMISDKGMVAIDWAIGARGNPLADYARTWLISRMWLGGLKEQGSERVYRMWQRFWEIYIRRYGELRPYCAEDLVPWQAVTAAASLCWEGSRIRTEPRMSLVQAVLDGTEHPWLCRQ
jgi:aminoglycoside phosphotransferase (APT) family kinase protein